MTTSSATSYSVPSNTLLLSLCFPTYNRASLLDGALRAALSQITPLLAGQVEVVVLDNASPDETPQVVAEVQAQYPGVRVRSVRRPENIGPDANFCTASAEAAGEFVYLLSDDDVLLPGAVATLLGLLQAYPTLDAVALNVREFRKSAAETEDKGFFKIQDRLVQSKDEALILLGTHLTFISCIAFRRANVLGRDYAARYDTNLAQAYMFLDALAPGNGMYVVQTPLLAKRADNNEGFDFFRVFVTNFHALMQYAQSIGYAPSAVRQVMDSNLIFLRYCVLLFKTNGAIGTIRPNYGEGLARLRRVYGLHAGMLLTLAPMMLLPRPLFRGMHRTYRSIKSRVVKPAPSAQHAQ